MPGPRSIPVGAMSLPSDRVRPLTWPFDLDLPVSTGPMDRLRRLYRGLSNRLTTETNVYDREWDVLVVLGGCQANLFVEVAGEYRFVSDLTVGRLRSVGTTREAWVKNTFTPDHRAEMEQTAYVTAGVESRRLSHADFAVIDEVWCYCWDDELHTVSAEAVTDRAVDCWRAGLGDRMIVHYAQPALPSISPTVHSSPREIYRDRLEYALESVEVLVASVDAERLVVTADHGLQFGTRGLPGHLSGGPRSTREVPWVELTARDTSGYEPLTRQQEAGEPDTEYVRELLTSLGYPS